MHRVIDHLAKVVKRVADKKDVNKMGLPNLAIVFAPSFLKDPSGSVLVQMENTQFEARCVCVYDTSKEFTPERNSISSFCQIEKKN